MVDVLIATRNRSKILDRCLMSLTKQTQKPSRVVVVDNNSSDNTRTLCQKYKKYLPIFYTKEQRIGLPFARNKSIQHIRNNICAFLDDDCIADSSWIEHINTHFDQHKHAVGVIGLTYNLTPTNTASLIEHTYYLRWVLSFITDIHKLQRIPSGRIIDFKNAAFRSSFIKNFSFSTSAPFGDVGDEDIEMGERLYKNNRHIYFDPSILVLHRYSQTVTRLITRNFWSGYANQMLRLSHDNNNQRSIPIVHKETDHRLKTDFVFLFILHAYPLSSKLGKKFAQVTTRLNLPVHIPTR